MSNKKFTVVVCDPPWNFKDSLSMSDVKRGADANYSTMSISDIKSLPVKDICDPTGALLCLWVPSSLLQEGLDTMKAWGFNHKQTYIWVKVKKNPLQKVIKAGIILAETAVKILMPKTYMKRAIDDISYLHSMNDMLAFGMGRLFRQTHEICLIGTNNNGIYKKLMNKSQRSVSLAPNLKHSAKPENLQDSLDIMFPGVSYLELFSRRQRKGWTCLGNEIDGKDIRDALVDLQ